MAPTTICPSHSTWTNSRRACVPLRDGLRSASTAIGRQGGGPPSFAGLHVDPDSGGAHLHGRPMELAPRELALLRPLLARPGQAVSRERLCELVFTGHSEVQVDGIEVVAYRLRKKIAGTDAQLVTQRGLGYLLKAAP
jgi:two-component system response regulator TctD